MVECKNIDLRRRTFADLTELDPNLATRPKIAGYITFEKPKSEKEIPQKGWAFHPKGILSILPLPFNIYFTT